MVAETSTSALILKVSRWFWNTLIHQAIAVIVVYIVWIGAKNYSAPFSWHVILSTFGYLPLMAEAIILFTGDNVWTQDLDRKKKYWLHGVLITMGTAVLTAGIALEIKRKDDRGSKHFVSDHALTGLISMILCLLSLILGLAAGNAQALRNFMRPVWYKFFHNFVGIAGYVIGIASLWFGYDYLKPEVREPLKIATAIITVWSLNGALISCYNQIKSIFS